MPTGIGGVVAATGGGAAGGGAVAAALGPVGWGLMAVSALTSIFGGGAKRRAARRAEERKRVLTNELNILEGKRQTIINPYAGITNLSGASSRPIANSRPTKRDL